MSTRPEDDDPTKRGMTDTDIVCGLRSPDPARRAKALEALCGVNGGLFIMSTVREQWITPTSNLMAGRVFPVVLMIAQQLGRALGLRLDWVPDQQRQQGLVIAQPEQLPPT